MMSDSYKNNCLEVNWQMSIPSSTANQWFDWDPTESFAPHELDHLLNWSQGTLNVLNYAFAKNLSRSVGWNPGNHKQKEAILQASKVYRRGTDVKNLAKEYFASSYQITFCENWEIDDPTTIYIVDKNLADKWNLQNHSRVITVYIDELSKNLFTVAELLRRIREIDYFGCNVWTIVGGGILSDTAAFAATLVGKKFQLIPTTLLAMLDACIGGKTGVNFGLFGKNQIGTFAFPTKVIISRQWLSTLPKREFLAGLSEAFKHALISGNKSLAHRAAMGGKNPALFFENISAFIEVKSQIISKDPTEQGIRASLNLGHTLAHAIERVSQLQSQKIILHGEAVAIGLLFCIELSHFLGLLKRSDYCEIWDFLINSTFLIKPSKLKILLNYQDLSNENLIQDLLHGIKQDKKNQTNIDSQWVLLDSWGSVYSDKGIFTKAVSDSTFKKCYLAFIQKWEAS